MGSEVEDLKRNRYFLEGVPDVPHSSRNHVEDWEGYHLPLLRMHQAHLHDWGIASGLEVSVTAGGGEVEVQPGVAVDGRGELIALSGSGQADIGLVEPGEADRQISAPFRLSIAGLAGQVRYLTIEYAQRLRLTEGVGGQLEQTPWLRLQATSGPNAYVDDSISIILAIVTVDGSGAAIVRERDQGLAFSRRLIGSTLETLHLRRATGAAGSIHDTLAARIEPMGNGGLQVTVPAAGDAMLLGRQDGGNFSALEVRADDLRTQGNLQVQGNLEVQAGLEMRGNLQSQGDVQVQGTTTLFGKVDIGDTASGANLAVNGSLKLRRGVAIEEFSTDGTLAGSRENAAPTERAVKEYVDNLLVGSITAFAMPVPPDGWLECNGQALDRTQFARLFARIGVTHGAGDGSTTFNVPDLRGLFVRGWDNNSGRDPNRVFGSYQQDSYQIHRHYFFGTFVTLSGGWHDHVDHNGGFWNGVKLAGGGDSQVRQYVGGGKTWGESHTHNYTPSGSISDPVGGFVANETRSKNRALMYCIKY